MRYSEYACPGTHTVDAELHAVAVAMGAAATHVLTRNRHTAQIRQFLAEHGLPVAAVHSAPTGESKWQHIADTLGVGERALFVDDSANEVADPQMVADPRVFRVLFQR